MEERIQSAYDIAFAWAVNYVPKVVLSIILFMIGQWLIRILKRWINHFFEAPKFIQVRPFLHGLVATILQVLLILLILQILGIKMTIFAAIIAAFGVAVGFALSGTLQNFASGILILLLKPYRIGDNIVTQGQEGKVSSIQLFYTVVTAFDNKTIIVPNSKLSNEIIINLSSQGKRRIDIEMKFNYGVDIEHIRKIVSNAIASSKQLLSEPVYRLVVSSIETDGYKMMINVWTEANGFLDTKYQLQENIISALKANEIKLPGM